MNNYFFIIQIQENYLCSYKSIDLNNASDSIYASYYAGKCFNDIKNLKNVGYILLNEHKKVIVAKGNIIDADFIFTIGIKQPNIKTVWDNELDYMEVKKVLEPYYKREVGSCRSIGDFLKIKSSRNNDYFIKPHYKNKKGMKSKHIIPFFIPKEIHTMDELRKYANYEEIFNYLVYDPPIEYSVKDDIFTRGEEYRVIIANNHLHSIQRYPQQDIIDRGGEVLQEAYLTVHNKLKENFNLERTVVSFDIVKKDKEWKLVEFHLKCNFLGHYHKTNQNDFIKYIECFENYSKYTEL